MTRRVTEYGKLGVAACWLAVVNRDLGNHCQRVDSATQEGRRNSRGTEKHKRRSVLGRNVENARMFRRWRVRLEWRLGVLPLWLLLRQPIGFAKGVDGFANRGAGFGQVRIGGGRPGSVQHPFADGGGDQDFGPCGHPQ